MSFQNCPPLVELPSPLFILGAAYSGKSELAIKALKADSAATVIGTAGLAELEGRIDKLKSLRPASWKHVEGHELNEYLAQSLEESKQLLVDSINQWLANVLLESWNKYDLEQQEARLSLEIRTFCETMQKHPDHRFVIVSSEIGAGVTPPQELSRFFRQLLGRLHQQIAAEAASVVQVVAGIPLLMKTR
ncbi:MAG: bifunctional adenosylcobinamide kinase/adenosylcobinamide-phosphate guanylyltransferase [Proteobacteria bacterium]|nr:MAG: bifunctional adenosylcobinamide kinase/adenosylcobinamide-phosphate guanylyltransferase [Pseudomonadota bacterium]